MTREIWKLGRPASTALEYSAILQFITSTASSNPAFTASMGQAPIHRATAYTPAVVNGCLLAVDGDGVMGAVLPAFAAAHAERLMNLRFSGSVHLHFARPAAAAHTDVF